MEPDFSIGIAFKSMAGLNPSLATPGCTGDWEPDEKVQREVCLDTDEEKTSFKEV